MQHNLISIRLIFLLLSTTLLIANCSRQPMAEPSPPTPTPLLAGDFFFEPSRDSVETRAIEVVIINLVKQRAPVVEHSIVITEPAVLREIISTLLAATSATCTRDLPTPQRERDYGVDLNLYSQVEILPLNAASSQWMIASIDYYPDENIIGIYRRIYGPEGRSGYITEFCPVGTVLREMLEREMALRGLAPPWR